jgi:hypothetical protein
MAQGCALPKFLIVLGGLVFVALGSAFTLAADGHSRREAGG